MFMSRLLVKSIFGKFQSLSLLYNLDNLFEFGISGGAQQFEKNHFCTGDMRSCAFHRVYSDLAVFRRARRDGIRDQMNIVSVGN
jgi:hypothetical protein